MAAQATNAFRTNLVSANYTRALSATRQSLVSGDYDAALRTVAEALQAKPGDSDALALQKEAQGKNHLRHAEALGKQSDYIGAGKELELTLQSLPDNDEAKQLRSDFKQHEPEQIARQQQERIESLNRVFNSFTEKINGASLVETHELKASKQVKEIQSGIVDQFQSVIPAFKFSHVGWTNEIFYMDADQEVPGGGRLCMIVGGQTKDDETRILFKVIEYKSEAIGLKILGAVLAAASSTKYQSSYQPINPSDAHLNSSDKNRITEGVRLVTEYIQRATGQAQAPSSP